MSESEANHKPKSENTIYGINWPPYVTREALDGLRDLEMRDDDVFVASYPKSGTHWVREIVRLINVNGHVENINRDQHCPSIEFGIYPEEFSADPHAITPPYIRVQNWASPRVLTTHVFEEFLPKQLKAGKGKVIYIIRNPKDTAVSSWYFIKDRQHMPSFVAHWNSYITAFIQGKAVMYGPWYAHVKQYVEKHKNSSNSLILYYEDMKKDHRSSVIKIAQFIGHPLSDEAVDRVVEHSSVKGMKRTHKSADKNSQDDNSSNSTELSKKTHHVGPNRIIRKGIVGDWKNHFTVSQNELFDNILQKELEGSGITVEYE